MVFRKMRIISYIFTIPACILFYVAEKIRGEKVSWRNEDVLEIFKSKKITCSKCGHKGKPYEM